MSGFFKALFNSKPPPSVAEQMAAITSRDAAEAAWRAGKLARIFLFPPEFGGEDRRENVVYVPLWIPEQKDISTRQVQALVRGGQVDELVVTPSYKDGSVVPAKLVITATKAGEPRYQGDIEIW